MIDGTRLHHHAVFTMIKRDKVNAQSSLCLSLFGWQKHWRWLRSLAPATGLSALLCHAYAQTNGPGWDLSVLAKPPQWTTLALPASSVAKAVFYTGASFHGKPTRVFAWVGIPKVKPGEKVPGMVLVHGGGGTALEDWVRLWVERGYAAISMDTDGKVPVGNGPDWVHDDQGGPPGWGGFEQIDWPPQDEWTYQAVADVILANSLLRSLPDVDPDRIGITGISWGGYSDVHCRWGGSPLQIRRAGLWMRILP